MGWCACVFGSKPQRTISTGLSHFENISMGFTRFSMLFNNHMHIISRNAVHNDGTTCLTQVTLMGYSRIQYFLFLVIYNFAMFRTYSSGIHMLFHM